jgi:methyl-accepting chemotaxis protein
MNTMIASAAEEQTSVAEDMNRSIVTINELSQNTSAGATQTSSASQELSKLATQLQSLVGQFKIAGG